MWGTTRMQIAFHSIFLYLIRKPAYKPEIVAQAKDKLDGKGNLKDEKTKELVRKKSEALKDPVLQA